MDVIRASWDREPTNRPTFEAIARDLRKHRAERSTQSLYSPPADSPRSQPLVTEWVTHHRLHHSPDILPSELPGDVQGYVVDHDPPPLLGPGPGLGLDIGGDGADSLASAEEIRQASRQNTWSTDTGTTASVEFDQSIIHASDYLSPPDPDDPDDMATMHRDERRYRMLLQHEYFTIRGSSSLP